MRLSRFFWFFRATKKRHLILFIALLVLFIFRVPNSAMGQSEAVSETTSLGMQAKTLMQQNHFAEAEPLFKRIIAIKEKDFGPNHLEVADSLDNLAEIYLRQDRYGEAEEIYQRIVSIREKYPETEQQLSLSGTLSNLAIVYDGEARYPEAEALLKRALAIIETHAGPANPKITTSLNVLALVYEHQSRDADAEPLLERSLAIDEKALGPEHPTVATDLHNLALVYQDEGRYAEAQTLYRRAVIIKQKALGPENLDVATALNNLAIIYIYQGLFADAEPLYKQSLAIYQKKLGLDHPETAAGLMNLGMLYEDQHRYAEAEALLKQSLLIKEKTLGPDHPDVADSLHNLGVFYQNQHRYADAVPLYERALAIKEKVLGPYNPQVAKSLNTLALTYAAQKRYTEALPTSNRAVSIVEKAISAETDLRSAANESERRINRGYFVSNVQIAYGAALNNPAWQPVAEKDAFRVAQLAATSSAAAAVSGMAARFAAANDRLAVAVREHQDLSLRWQRLDQALVQSASSPPGVRDATAEDALRKKLAETAANLDSLDARMLREFPQYAELNNPKPVDVEAVQAMLAPDEAMLVYLITRDLSFLWAVRRDAVQVYWLDVQATALTDEVAKLRQRLDPDLNPNLLPFDAKRAHALYEKILAPALPLLAGAKQVFVVPDGALESLPFGVLVTKLPAENPENLADHREIAWFARDCAITVLPSVGTLSALRQFAKNSQASEPFIGFGNPVLKGKPGPARGIKPASLFRGAVADVDAVRQLPPLPETAEELRAVAKATGADEQNLYLAERATEPLLLNAGLERYRVVEFATHALMSGDLQGLAEPALVMTPPKEATPANDGLLTASKVATLKLNADWVVLSACNTAASDGTPDAGGLSGLAKAFFYAGARSLLVSNWSVPSKAAVKLVTGAFDELKKDSSIGRAEALRRAEMAMLAPTSPPEFAHPMFWAPFVLAGEGGVGH